MSSEHGSLPASQGPQNTLFSENVAETEKLLRTQVGPKKANHPKRRNEKIIVYAVIAAHVLMKFPNYTIDVLLDSEEMLEWGHKTLWRYLAFKFVFDVNGVAVDPGKLNMTIRFEGMRGSDGESWKIHPLNRRAAVMCSAFKAFTKRFNVDHPDDRIVMVSRRSDTNRTEIITGNLDLMVSEGQTVGDVYCGRTETRIKGSIKSALETTRAMGIERMKKLGVFIKDYIKEFTDNTQPMLSFGDPEVLGALNDD